MTEHEFFAGFLDFWMNCLSNLPDAHSVGETAGFISLILGGAILVVCLVAVVRFLFGPT